MKGIHISADSIARLTFWVEIIGFFVINNGVEMFSGILNFMYSYSLELV